MIDENVTASQTRKLLGLALFAVFITVMSKTDYLTGLFLTTLLKVNELGFLAYVYYVVIYALGTVLFLPGTPFIVLGGLLFGLFRGFVLVSIASMSGAAIALLLGRYLLIDWAKTKAEKQPNWRYLNQKLKTKGGTLLAVLRVSPLYPASIGNYLFGSTTIPLKKYVFYSWIGSIPNFLFYLYLGAKTTQYIITQKITLDNPLELIMLIIWVSSTLFLPLIIRKMLTEDGHKKFNVFTELNTVNKNNPETTIDLKIKRSKKVLFKTLNCCETQVINALETHKIEDNEILKAVTGLAGGLYNHGSTCGVILGIALSYALELQKNKPVWEEKDEVILINNVKEYVEFFKKQFNSTLCRERTELDFKTIKGKLGLLIPEKVKGCVKQTALSVKYYEENRLKNKVSEKDCPLKNHCAREVLEKVREKTGIGNKRLEQLAVVFDGGIGLTGNSCGALIGGLMVLGLKYKKDYSLKKATSFRNMFKAYPKEFRNVANQLIDEFENQFGALECGLLTKQEFENTCDFNRFWQNNPKCRNIVDFVTNKTILLLQEKQ